MTIARRMRLAVGVVLLLALPYLPLPLPVFLSGSLNAPGNLHLAAVCLVYAGMALSFDLLYGHTGLLSFGHALPIATGSYLTNIGVTHFGWTFVSSAGFAVLVAALLSTVVGALALRAQNFIAFAMATLAFAEAGAVLVLHDPGGFTGGDEGLTLSGPGMIQGLVGADSRAATYWVALAFATLAFTLVRWLVRSSPGRIWAAIRENQMRVVVLGLSVYRYKLGSFVIGSTLGALGGVIFLLVSGGSRHTITSSHFTLMLLVMVILGGSGTRWGPVVGGVTYIVLDTLLVRSARLNAVEELPDILAVPLSQPTFTLGLIFVLVVLFFPGGVVGAFRAMGLNRRSRTVAASVETVNSGHGSSLEESTTLRDRSPALSPSGPSGPSSSQVPEPQSPEP